MGFKMKKPSMTQGTKGHREAVKNIKLNRNMDKTSLSDGRAGSSPFQKTGSPMKALDDRIARTEAKTAKLQEKKEYQPLVKTILDNTKEICKMYEYEYEELEITNMWINYSQKGDMHSPHNHSNNTFSGVWYPFHSKTQTPIFFQDPRPSNGVWQPRKTKVSNITTT